jgi:aminopeptidase N
MQIVGGSKMQPWVPQDVARCVAFYQTLFGPAQVPSFVVTQIPALHGEAFPGMLNIPETSFDGPTAVAEDQVFRSHEVAHQWWGYGVDGRTYHDHWLTEGFANFSALWYLQAGLARPKDYLAVLGDWREDLIVDRATRPERGRQPGPIWLGYRNATRSRPQDYVLVDYKKGAWVLHMLRSLLLDLDTMDDRRFVTLMQAFYRQHAGGYASTEDFRRVAEAHAGEDLGWFFDQWVYGTGIPTYRFAHRIEPADHGQYRVRCRVAQSGVPPGFTMPVTLRVEFGNDRFAWVRRTITGATAEFELPLMPEKPVNVVFNDNESALCEVKRTDW